MMSVVIILCVIASILAVSETAMEVNAASTNWSWPTSVHTIKSDWPTYSSGSYHGGTDFLVALNSPVYSTCDGEVVAVTSLTTSYGKHIKIKATVNGSIVYMRYCHLNSFAVSVGDKVTSGQLIAYSGSTGNSTGPHLHYEVRKGGTSGTYHTDPYNYLRNYVASIINDTVSSNNNSLINNNNTTTDITNTTSTNSGLFGLSSAFNTIFDKLLSPLSTFTNSVTNEFYKLLGFSGDDIENSTGILTDLLNNNTSTENNDTSSNSSSSSGSSDTVNAKTMSKSPTSTAIYNYFKAKGLPDVSIAAILGNLNAESGLRTNNLEDQFESEFGLDDREYTNAVNNGSYGDTKFINDSAGYGLAQWTHSSRKKPLLNLARSNNKSIDDFTTQINHLYNELVDYGTFNLLKNYTTVKDANDRIIHFLSPNIEKYPNIINDRLGRAKGYYNLYKNDNKDTSAYLSSIGGGIGGSIDESTSTTPYLNNYNKFNTSKSNFKRSISSILNSTNNTSTNTTIDNVLDYLKKIADGIMSIVDNTDNTNIKLEDIKKIESEKPEAQNKVAVIDNSKKQSNSPMFDIASNRRTNRSNKEYQTAKLIASGG